MRTPLLPADYARHETAYQAIRARGAPGWSDDVEYAHMMGLVAPALPPPRAGVHILELGSGAGNFSLALAERGYRVTGVDIAPTAVSWANERAAAAAQRPEFRVDDVTTLATVKSGSVDVVVDGHCLHCIVGDDRARCFAAVQRALRPGGVFVVLTMCGDVLDERLRQAFDPATRVVVMDGRPTRYIGMPDAIVDEVRAAGFHVARVHVEPRKAAHEQDDLLIVAHARAATKET